MSQLKLKRFFGTAKKDIESEHLIESDSSSASDNEQFDSQVEDSQGIKLACDCHGCTITTIVLTNLSTFLIPRKLE